MRLYDNNTLTLFEFDKVCSLIEQFCRNNSSKKLAQTDHPMYKLMQDPTVTKLVPLDTQKSFLQEYARAEQSYQKANKEGNTFLSDLNLAEMAKVQADVWKSAMANPGTFVYAKPSEHMDKLDLYAKGQNMQPGFVNEAKGTKKDTRSEKDKSKDKFDSAGGYQGL
jgi:hypothetical protein